MVSDVDVDFKELLVKDRHDEVECGVGVRNDQEQRGFLPADGIESYRIFGKAGLAFETYARAPCERPSEMITDFFVSPAPWV